MPSHLEPGTLNAIGFSFLGAGIAGFERIKYVDLQSRLPGFAEDLKNSKTNRIILWESIGVQIAKRMAQIKRVQQAV